MFLYKKRVTSNASRRMTIFKTPWYDRNIQKYFKLRKKSFGGRNRSGRTTLWTRKSIKRRLFYCKINYHFRSPQLFFIQTLKILTPSHKVVASAYFASGSVCYLQATSNFNIFQIRYPLYRTRFENFRIMWPDPYFSLLRTIPRLSKISLVELYPGKGVQYIRSAGCAGKLVTFNWDKHTAVVQLPSGVRKLFSLHSIASYQATALSIKKYHQVNNAGYLKNFGKKSIVRGVAMNPIDHPHGGRTKAIKYPRTPWGKTTKFK